MKNKKDPEKEKPKYYDYYGFLSLSIKALDKTKNSPYPYEVVKYWCKRLEIFDNYLANETIKTWSEKFGYSEKLLQAYRIDEEPELTPHEELKEYLIANYEIKQNSISKRLIIKQDGQEITKAVLLLNCDNAGYKTKHLNTYLDPVNDTVSVCKEFNPLKKFFLEARANWKGEDVIGKLCSFIPAYDFGDKEEKNFYQNRLKYYFKKWLAKAVGQVFDIDKNDAMLLWISPDGGIGKSYLNEWLFDIPEMQEYYKGIKENESFDNFAGLSLSHFVMDFDELPMKKTKYNKFKSYVSASTIKMYTKGSLTGYTSHKRQVNYMGSSNLANRRSNAGTFQKGFLLDDDAALRRRMITIEINKIDRAYSEIIDGIPVIDRYQLIGQAVDIILKAQEDKDKSILTYECDHANLVKDNERYINANQGIEKNILSTSIQKADKENGKLISATDIIKELQAKGIKVTLSPEQVGVFLFNNKFDKGREGNYRGWWVGQN